MKQTDEVDDLLTRAGARWRADQEAPPEPDLDRMLSGGRGSRRRWVPALAAASVAVIGAGLLTVLPNNDPSPESSTAAPPTAPAASVTPGARQPFAEGNDKWLVKPGDKVQVSGEIIAAPGKVPVFCPPLMKPAIGYPPGKEPAPTCPDSFAVRLNGLDVDQVTGLKTIKGVRTGLASVTGVWRGGAIDVQEQSAPRPVGDDGPTELKCPEPPGGWTSKPSNVSAPAVTKFLEAHADQVRGPILTYPNGRSRNAPVVVLIGLARGDETAFRAAFDKVYRGNYCVVPVQLSSADEQRITDQVADLSGAATLGIHSTSGPGIYAGGVTVGLVAYTPEVKQALTPIGLDLLSIRPDVRPVR
jgi:hypothetical protein